MSLVLEPAELCGISLRNRFIRSAAIDSTPNAEGAVTEQSVRLFEGLAAGGIGLIVTGAALATPRPVPVRSTTYGIYSDALIPGLRRLVEAAHRHGAKIAVQIVHTGAIVTGPRGEDRVVVVPSELDDAQTAQAANKVVTREATADDIDRIIEDTVAAAKRGREAGFDAVQFHACHGDLVARFFSPLTNRRTDKWGGNAENRWRILVETVRRIRAAVGPDYPLLTKFGVLDDAAGGATLEEGLAALQAMAEAGLSAAEISHSGVGGGVRPDRLPVEQGAEVVPYRQKAAAVKKAVGIPVILVGGIRRLETAEEIVSSGDADFVSLCRPFIREPNLVRRWTSGDRAPAKCISCQKCTGIMARGEPLECGEERRIREGRG